MNVQLHQDETELVNGSIVFDEHGQAYRYYASESAYQAAHGLNGLAPANPTRLPEPTVTHSADDDTTTAFSLGFRLGNAAPPQTFTMPEPVQVVGHSATATGWHLPKKHGGHFAHELAFGNVEM